METMKKVNLAEKADSYWSKVAENRKAKAVAYVVDIGIPHLTTLAERGQRIATLSYPTELSAEDVIDALEARVECTVRKPGIKPRLEIRW